MSALSMLGNTAFAFFVIARRPKADAAIQG
jgi:hypothetical protein